MPPSTTNLPRHPHPTRGFSFTPTQRSEVATSRLSPSFQFLHTSSLYLKTTTATASSRTSSVPMSSVYPMRVMMKGKLPLSLTVTALCVAAFVGLMFAEDLRALTGAKSGKLKACCKQDSLVSNSESLAAKEKEIEAALEEEDEEEEDGGKEPFIPGKCAVENGKWVFNRSAEPPYTDTSCPYLDKQVECAKNGRPDDAYLHWQWKMDDCDLQRFDAVAALEKLRGKRLMFVGDSLQRGQWQSFVCLVQSHLAPEQKSMRRGKSLSVFKAKEYNASIEFYWAPFLVESNSDVPIVADASKRILRVDSVSRHAKNWVGVDILVFNTYVWWMTGRKIKSLWGSFANGEEGFEELEAAVAYRIALKTWANWVESNINPNTTRVLFTTMSPTHMRSRDWRRDEGIRCYNETRPIARRGHWGTGSDRGIMAVVSDVVARMKKVPVSFVNITQLSEYRVDGHASVYTESRGKVLTAEQKADPRRYADCIHWCLPGVPDTWNQLLFAYL